MDKKKEKEIETIREMNESNDSNKMGQTINDMLDKVMEENDPSNSFDFGDDEEESFKLSRHSTRHQTTVKPQAKLSNNPKINQFFSQNFNRGNKRNLTQSTTPSFNNQFYNSNPFVGYNPSFFFPNNGNNAFAPNFLNNNFGFNNNLNQSFQSYHSFNPQYSNNFLNSSMEQNNFVRNSMPYSKTISYHNQGNILNLGKNFVQPNYFNLGNNNNNNNMQMIFNRQNQGYFNKNLDMEFKRGENRKKTYDVRNSLISNCLNNNMNNLNNNMKNTNARIGLNLNLNKNNNSNIKNNMNKQNNYMNNMNRNMNPKNNANNVNNMNRNIPSNNNNVGSDSVISRALNMIRGEFKKKDELIRQLELKVEELEEKIKLYTKNNETNDNYNNINDANKILLNNNYMGNLNNNIPQKKIGKNFTFSEKNSEEFNNNLNIQDNYDRINKVPEMNYNMNKNNNLWNKEGNIRKKYQPNTNNQYQINENNQNDYMIPQQKYNEPNNEGQRENSIKTWNSGNYHGFSKTDVKLYLKEVKAKLDYVSFHEFIRNIKLLTSSKEQGNIDRKSIVERVRILLLETDDELFEKFKKIIGYNE